MAGESTLLTQYYPDDFDIVSFQFNTSSGGSLNDPTPLLYADRNLIIDTIIVGVVNTGGTSAAASFEQASNPNATNGTVVAVAAIDGTNAAAGDTIVLTTDGVTRSNGGTATTTTGNSAIDRTTNFIPKGNWLIIDVTGNLSSANITVQIRYRSRPK